MRAKSYRDLEVYQLVYEFAMKIHHMSLKLPKYELYEEGSQIRRSSKGIAACIKKKMINWEETLTNLFNMSKPNGNNSPFTSNQQSETRNEYGFKNNIEKA